MAALSCGWGTQNAYATAAGLIKKALIYGLETNWRPTRVTLVMDGREPT